MKLFIKIIITIVLLGFSLFSLDSIYFNGLRANKNTKADYVSSSKINADILIHGPCEPLWMVNPARLDSFTGLRSYNLALSHSDFADNYLHLYLYLKNNKAPRLIMLYVTPESMDKRFNTFNSYRFAQFLNEDIVLNVVRECDNNYFKKSSPPFLSYAYYNKEITFNVLQGYKHKVYGRLNPFFVNGFEPPAKIIWDNHLEDMQSQYPLGFEFKIDTLRVKYLKKIIELAKTSGSKIVLYESPVLEESLKSLKNREEVILSIKKIASEQGIQYVLFKNEQLSSSRENYISSLNLNAKGLVVFNDSLAQFLKIYFKN